MRSTSCVLRIEAFDKAFDEGVKAVYGPRWESNVLGQCRPLEGVGKTRHRMVSLLVYRFA